MPEMKITRRTAVLGTAVAGITGANAIVYMLKRDYQLPDLGATFEPEWQEHVNSLNAMIRSSSGPVELELAYRPPIGDKFKVQILFGTYKLQDYPAAPLSFYAMQGDVQVVPPLANEGLPGFEINSKDSDNKTRTKMVSTSGGECLAFPEGGDMQYFQTIAGTGGHKALEIVPIPCREVGLALSPLYPNLTGENLKVGQQWTLQDSAYDGVDLACKLEGYAEVNGRHTTRISIKRQLNHADTVKYIQHQHQLAREADERAGREFDSSYAKNELEHARMSGKAISWHINEFVELATGLTVRREFKRTNSYSNGSQDKIINISQANQA
jgi:hypothetical protein